VNPDLTGLELILFTKPIFMVAGWHFKAGFQAAVVKKIYIRKVRTKLLIIAPTAEADLLRERGKNFVCGGQPWTGGEDHHVGLAFLLR
jgi:hypothetical protein